MNNFSEKIIQILNHGALNLALGIGYSQGIFDVMDELGKPAIIPALAKAANLDRRYLKEWLGIMVTGNIIDMAFNEKGEETFFLPPAHGDVLTVRAGNQNLGVYTQEIPLLASCAMEPVSKGFSTGKGVGFSHYPSFQAFMSELSNAKHRQVLIQEFLPSVNNGRLVEALKKGIQVCDLGCGQGVALNLMAQAFPNSRFLGVDNHQDAIEEARVSVKKMNLVNVDFTIMDAGKIKGNTDFYQKFDYVCAFDAIHDQSHPLQALKGIHYMLKPRGIFSMIDIKASTSLKKNLDHPMGPFLYTVSLMHCMPVGLNDNGRGLGMMWGREQALDLLKQAGFNEVDAVEIPNDPFNLHFFCRPQADAAL